VNPESKSQRSTSPAGLAVQLPSSRSTPPPRHIPNFRTSANVPPSRRSAFNSIFLYSLLSVFTLAGLGVLGLSIRELNQGGPNGWGGLGFACVWLLGCAVALWVLIWSNREAAHKDSDSSPFQTLRPGPREERISGATGANSLTAAVVSLAFGGGGLACLIGSLRSVNMEGRNIGIGMGSLFLALGLLFFIGGIMAFVHRRKFGMVSIRLTGPATRIGGRLAGVLEVPKGVLTDDRFKLRLTCTRVTVTRQGDSDHADSESRESLWTGEEILRPAGKRPDGRVKLPFAFVLPAGLPKSGEANPRIEWCVNVAASVPGLDFRESFPLQVSDESDAEPFATDESSPPIRGDSIHPRGSTPFQAQPAWAAGRIEADRRVGPVWPGMPGIGIVPRGAAGLLAAVPNVARRLQHIVSALVILVLVALIASAFTRGHGLDFLDSILTTLPSLLNRWIWVVAPVGGCIHRDGCDERAPTSPSGGSPPRARPGHGKAGRGRRIQQVLLAHPGACPSPPARSRDADRGDASGDVEPRLTCGPGPGPLDHGFDGGHGWQEIRRDRCQPRSVESVESVDHLNPNPDWQR